MKNNKKQKKLKKKRIRNTRKKRGNNNHNNKGKKKMNNKVIKPFITRGSIVGTNGERKVVMNKDGLSSSQLDWVYGFEKSLTKSLDKIEEDKGEKIKDNYLTYCFYKDDEDFLGSLMVDLENENGIDEVYDDFVCLFNSGSFTNGLKFSPKHLTDEEIEYVKCFVVDKTQFGEMVSVSHKDGKISGKWGIDLYFPSPKSKEIWSIIYDTEPSLLNETTN